MFGTNYTGGGVLSYRSAEEINSAMGRVYGHMSLAVVVSMLVSYFVGTSPELLEFFFTGVLKWIVIFAPLAAIFGVSYVLGILFYRCSKVDCDLCSTSRNLWRQLCTRQ